VRDDIKQLVRGNKAAWDAFVERFSPVIYSAVRRTLQATGGNNDDVLDVAQNVFVRLCKNDYRLLRSYDPARASLCRL
jgi:RNA polymerase sigma-70 factor (ECF subfamily)